MDWRARAERDGCDNSDRRDGCDVTGYMNANTDLKSHLANLSSALSSFIGILLPSPAGHVRDKAGIRACASVILVGALGGEYDGKGLGELHDALVGTPSIDQARKLAVHEPHVVAKGLVQTRAWLGDDLLAFEPFDYVVLLGHAAERYEVVDALALLGGHPESNGHEPLPMVVGARHQERPPLRFESVDHFGEKYSPITTCGNIEILRFSGSEYTFGVFAYRGAFGSNLQVVAIPPTSTR